MDTRRDKRMLGIHLLLPDLTLVLNNVWSSFALADVNLHPPKKLGLREEHLLGTGVTTPLIDVAINALDPTCHSIINIVHKWLSFFKLSTMKCSGHSGVVSIVIASMCC